MLPLIRGMTGVFHFMPDKIGEQVKLALHLFPANTNQFPLMGYGVGTISWLMRAISRSKRGAGLTKQFLHSLFAGLVANLVARFAKQSGRKWHWCLRRDVKWMTFFDISWSNSNHGVVMTTTAGGDQNTTHQTAFVKKSNLKKFK